MGLVAKTCETGSHLLATDSTCPCQVLLLGPTSLQPASALRLPVFLIDPTGAKGEPEKSGLLMTPFVSRNESYGQGFPGEVPGVSGPMILML